MGLTENIMKGLETYKYCVVIVTLSWYLFVESIVVKQVNCDGGMCSGVACSFQGLFLSPPFKGSKVNIPYEKL